MINLNSNGEHRSSHRHRPPGLIGDSMKIPANIILGTASIKDLKAWMFSIEDIEIEEAQIQGFEREDQFFAYINDRAVASYVDEGDGSTDYKFTHHIISNMVYNHSSEGQFKTLGIVTIFERGEYASWHLSHYIDR